MANFAKAGKGAVGMVGGGPTAQHKKEKKRKRGEVSKDGNKTHDNEREKAVGYQPKFEMVTEGKVSHPGPAKKTRRRTWSKDPGSWGRSIGKKLKRGNTVPGLMKGKEKGGAPLALRKMGGESGESTRVNTLTNIPGTGKTEPVVSKD